MASAGEDSDCWGVQQISENRWPVATECMVVELLELRIGG